MGRFKMAWVILIFTACASAPFLDRLPPEWGEVRSLLPSPLTHFIYILGNPIFIVESGFWGE
jgi:hypothetical protein